MTEIVGYKFRDGVALITVDNPPINALSQPVRAGLRAAVTRAIGDPSVGAIVIQAEGRTFPAGADLKDFRAHVEAPGLGDVCALIEASPKPVLAAIHGTALGGGFELALACHYRLALHDAQLGLPEVALGLVPSAGASQRLPRIVGARRALDLLVSARPISAEGAARIGLVDKVIQKNLARAAFGSARNMIGADTPPRPSCDRREGFADPRAYFEELEARRAALEDDRQIAVHKAVDLVEAALLLPFEAGVALEAAAFEDLVDSDQARGLRHAFLAERRTTRGLAIAPGRARPIASIGVIGSGRRAEEITRAALAVRRPVVLHDDDAPALDAAVARIEAALAEAVDSGALETARHEAQLALLHPAPDPEALGTCDVVIEAFEDGEEAAAVEAFARLGQVAAPMAVLASSSAADGASLDARALACGNPGAVLGFRFSEPVAETRLVELIRRTGAAVDLDVTGIALAQALRRVPVLSAKAGESLVAPMRAAFWRALLWLVEEGATPEAIDAALSDYGFSHAPFALLDRASPERLGTRLPFLELLRAQGPGGDLDTAIAARRDELGLTARAVGADEISARTEGALVATGAVLLAKGIAARPSDLDAAMVLGEGFPRWRGGPMEAADLLGLLKMRTRLRGFCEGRDGALWQPGAIFDELIKNGRGFDSLNH